jgi:hypothetical protein
MLTTVQGFEEFDLLPILDLASTLVTCFTYLYTLNLVKKNIGQFVAWLQRDWDARLSIGLFPCSSSMRLRSWPRLQCYGEENFACPAVSCLGNPRHIVTHQRSFDPSSGPSTQLWSFPPSQTGQRAEGNSVRQSGQLCGLPWGWQITALSPNPQEGWVAQFSILMGIAIEGVIRKMM